jgi:hypothetical protein
MPQWDPTPQDGACEGMRAQHSVWVVRECEPDLWALLVAQRAWFAGPVREGALRQSLVQLHALSTLLHGPLQALLDAVCCCDAHVIVALASIALSYLLVWHCVHGP